MTRARLHLVSRLLALFVLAAGVTPAAAEQAPRPGSIEDRLGRIERSLNSGALTQMVNQQEELRQTLQDLRGQIEVLRRDLDEVKQRQSDLYGDLDRRLRLLETAPTRPSASATVAPPVIAAPPAAGPGTAPGAAAPSTPAANPPAASNPPPSTGDEFNDYQAAFSLLKAGRYPQSAEAFEAFLQRYPKGQFAPNALYWLGESYYVVRDFDKAQQQFQRVLNEYPDNSKRADALLKIGFIHFEQGDMTRARTILEKVKADYPNSSAAALAEQRLLRMAQPNGR